ncbi:MAG: ABC transporter ATP-binding protein, partial [Calditrichia bacterium]|nr:ABC transporter ATP-binding protein [Calditrichia bacterium]
RGRGRRGNLMKPIELKNVEKYFEEGFIPKKNHVLKNISFSLESGKTYAYLGPNGAGKTTTIKLLLNFLKPSKGEISIYGKSPADPVFRGKIGYVSDHPYFYEYLSAEEYLTFCGELYKMEQSEIKKRSHIMFEMVGLQNFKKMKLRKFSRGMGQRLSFAQALLHDPELIILDEPLNGLDPFGRKDLQSIIQELKSRGKTIFFSSHILDDAEVLADKLIFLNKGEIIFNGDLQEVKGKEEVTFQVFLEKDSKSIIDFCNKNNIKTELAGNIFEIKKLTNSQLNELMALVAKDKIKILSINEQYSKLEDIFLNYYRGNINENS